MVKKLILICLVWLLGIVALSGPVWASSSPSNTFWMAQMETPARTVPSEQPRPETQPKTQTDAPSATEQTAPKQTETDQQSPSVKQQSEPFNPYDMKALKQFDAGDHRAK